MLNCIYHPTEGMRVVPSEEQNGFLASGFWFDSPLKAEEYRQKVEADIKNETKPVRKSRFKKENENEK
jgi:hypothetical protein